MNRPPKSALEALLELLDEDATREALDALEAILEKQAERSDSDRAAA
jgi:hypothetical protein